MTSITDFSNWLDHLDLAEPSDVYNLYCSVHGDTDMAEFNTAFAKNSDTRRIVTSADLEISLVLASDKAKDALLKHLEATHCGEMNMEGWYYYHHHAMAKDD